MNRRELLKSLGAALISPLLPSLPLAPKVGFNKLAHKGVLAEMTKTQKELCYLQLYRAGIIDIQTLAGVWNIPLTRRHLR